MKKIISFVISLACINFLYSAALIAQENSTTTTQSSNKIGLDIVGFLGTGDMETISQPEHPKNTYSGKYSDSTFPAYNLSISYFVQKHILLGLGYQFNSVKFTTTELSENNTDYYREVSSKRKIHQFSLNIIATTTSKSLNVYAGINLFPFIKEEGVGRSDTSKFAYGGLIGLKYNVCSIVNLLLQYSSERSVSVSVKEANNVSTDNFFDLSSFMFGIGFSI